ncbi:MAG: hypothetical protein HY741_04580 [Chloroflexi bacterium]|nr:hypothetical protein [Chloroflexota bacterium]
MRSKYLLIGLSILVFSVTVAVLLMPSNAAKAKSGLVTSDCGQVPPTDLGIRVSTPPSDLPAQISSAQAIQTASEKAYVKSQLPAPLTKTAYVLYSNDSRGNATTIGDDDSADQNLVSQDVPAWIITFCGVVTYPHVFDKPGPSSYGGINVTPRNEWNVVVNAQTGQVIEQYSIR